MRTIAYLLPLHDAVRPGELRLALRSIAQQDLPEDTTLRLYVGVDGEIDAAKQRMLEEAKPYRHIRLEGRSGLPVVLNRLIDLLEDEDYVFRMDADDICEPARTAAQMAYMDANPGIGICGTGCTQIDEFGRRVNRRHYPTDPARMRDFICTAIPLLHPTFCFRRAVLERLRYDETAFYQQDLVLLFDALAAGIELGNVDRPLLLWRTGRTFHRRRTAKRAFAECRLYFSGIYRLHGLTWRYMFPLARLAMRLLPVRVFTTLDRLNLRQTLLEPRGAR